MKSFKKKADKFFKMALLVSCSVITFAACGGGGGGGGAAAPGTTTGTFVDSAVDGLTYTATPSGLNGATQNGGQFNCKAGDTVGFAVGDVNLGQAPCQGVVTPVDLVTGATDETNPVVTNIARFLQSLDADLDPSNGININLATTTAVIGRNIDITDPNFDTDTDAEAQALFNALGITPVTASAAKAHLQSTLAELQNSASPSEFVGTYDGLDDRGDTYLHLFSNNNYTMELSSWPGSCGEDCRQNSIMRIFGTYAIANNTLTLYPNNAQDVTGNAIQTAAIDPCWSVSPHYQSTSFPKISYQNGMYFPEAVALVNTPARPQDCVGGGTISAGTLLPKVHNDPSVYLITSVPAPTATITVNGNTSDWAGISPMITDTTGDCSSVSGCDISKVYIAKDSQKVYLRLDLANGAPSNTLYYGVAFYPQAIHNAGDRFIFIQMSGPSASVESRNAAGSGYHTFVAAGTIAVSGSTIEVSVPLASLNPPATSYVGAWNDVDDPMLDGTDAVLVGF